MFLKSLRIVFIIALVFLFLFSAWFSYEFYFSQKGPENRIIFEVKKGETASSIATNLKETEVIKKKWALLLGYKLFFSHKSLKAGEYAIQQPVTPKQVLELITEGRALLYPITIPEGLTRKETASLFQSLNICGSESFLEASADTRLISAIDDKALDLEGYLFPETYHFPKETSEKEIVEAMVSQFKEVFNKEWKKRLSEIGFTVRKVVILASLIEKETSLPDERSIISAVFRNRLKIGMKLDCDPTIIYALKQVGQFKDRLRTKDLMLDSPYNTYLYPGLPPSPIANPGKDSLKAALFPAEEDYLYFVSKNDGSHHFSRTFKEHQMAVIKYQKTK